MPIEFAGIAILNIHTEIVIKVKQELTHSKPFVHMDKYIGDEDHYSIRYAIIFAIGVNNDRKQTNNNNTINRSTDRKEEITSHRTRQKKSKYQQSERKFIEKREEEKKKLATTTTNGKNDLNSKANPISTLRLLQSPKIQLMQFYMQMF